MKVAKSGTAEELIIPKAGMNAVVHLVLDEVVLVDFFHDTNTFFIQVGKTSNTVTK